MMWQQNEDPGAPFRDPEDAHRLEAMGFSLAKQVIAPAARAREERDLAFREELVPVKAFLRPHVFSDGAARDAACRPPAPGDILTLEPTAAGNLGPLRSDLCLFAIGHGIDSPGFEAVASAVAAPEVADLAEHRASKRRLGGVHGTDSIVLTIAGALYQLTIDGDGKAEVRAKSLFGAVPNDELARTGAWLLGRLRARSGI